MFNHNFVTLPDRRLLPCPSINSAEQTPPKHYFNPSKLPPINPTPAFMSPFPLSPSSHRQRSYQNSYSPVPLLYHIPSPFLPVVIVEAS